MATVENYSNLPYEQRWEPLKAIMIGMYEGGATIPQLSKQMSDDFNFRAE